MSQQQQQHHQPAIYYLKFPFCLKKDQLEAVNKWANNNFRGTVLYSSGTGKTEIAFECAKRALEARTTSTKPLTNKEYSSIYFPRDTFNILFLVPRIVLIEQNVKRLSDYGIPKERIGVYFGERKKIRKRKAMLACAETKLSTAIDLIAKKHPNERIMVFSETLDSINKLRDRLNGEGITSKIIDSTLNSTDRQKILDQWGRNFYPLLSVHTLEIGYDIPQVRIEIILATTSNMNQVIQRIGRAIRKYEGKDLALIYVVYVSDTKDDNVLDIVKKAIQERRRTYKAKEEKSEIVDSKPSSGMEKRIKGAYNIIETSLYEPMIVEEICNKQKRLFRVRSSKQKGKFYDIDAQNKTCSCPDYIFRQTKCKHILAMEFMSTPLS